MATTRNAPKTILQTIGVQLPAMTGENGEILIDVPVIVSDFIDIGAISLTLNYDSNVLTFKEGENTSGFNGLGFGSSYNQVRIGGFGSGTSYPDNTILCKLKFIYKGGQCKLSWALNNPASCEYTDSLYQVLNDGPDFYKNGYVLPYVKIGEQYWMAENLNIGELIDTSIQQRNNGVIEKYYYNNTESEFGGYYAWDEMMNYSMEPGSQGIAPDGWHIPTKSEFEVLIKNTMGTNPGETYMREVVPYWNTAAIPLKINDGTWSIPPMPAKDPKGITLASTNETLFSAKPAGWVSPQHGSGDKSYTTFFWSSSWGDATAIPGQYVYPLAYQMIKYHNALVPIPNLRTTGLSVRCIRNDSQSENPPPTPIELGLSPIISIPPSLTIEGQTFEIPVSVKNYKNIIKGNLYFGINSNYMEISSIVPIESGITIQHSTNNDITNVVIDSTDPLTLSGTTVLFKILCKTLKFGTNISPIIWENYSTWNTPQVKIPYDDNCFLNGSVKMIYYDVVVPPSASLTSPYIILPTLTPTSTYTKFGTAISVKQFKDVSNFSFTIKYDPKIVKLNMASKSSKLPGANISYKSNLGEFTITWKNSTMVTVPDNTTIITLTTELISPPVKGSTTNLQFVNCNSGMNFINGKITIK